MNTPFGVMLQKIFLTINFIFVQKKLRVLQHPKPLFFLTNDDGITAKGLYYIASLLTTIADVIVVAPNGPRSGMSHAMTLENPLYCETYNMPGIYKAYACSGTPVDCVKLGLVELLKDEDRTPSLCISGVNHGSNASVNTLYSATVSAAVEASLHQIPALAVSLLDHDQDAHFEHATSFILDICHKILNKTFITKGTLCLNMNIPKFNPDDLIKGIQYCKQSKAYWRESFVKNYSPTGKPYYWITGKLEVKQTSESSDLLALEDNYISLVPIHNDRTDYSFQQKEH